MKKNTYFFDLYGTLIDIRTDENRPSLWRGLARYYALGGAEYTPAEIRARYLALCAEETEALAGRSGIGEDAVEIELRDVFAVSMPKRASAFPQSASTTRRSRSVRFRIQARRG